MAHTFLSPLYSMSGFAEARGESDGRNVTVAIKSVNHRFLDLRWNVPAEAEAWVPDLEKLIRQGLSRGHVEVRLSLEVAPAARAGFDLNRNLAEDYLRAHAELRAWMRVDEAPSVVEILRCPGMLTARSALGAADGLKAAAAEVFEAALRQLQQMRRAEGEALALDLRSRLDRIEGATEELVPLQAAIQGEMLERARQKIAALLGAAAPSPERLLQEAALLAERSDVSEELTRLRAHIAQCRAVIEAGGEVGKRLDFLTQELNREANTLLSKAAGVPSGLRITTLGLDLKAEIEKIREQVQNLE